MRSDADRLSDILDAIAKIEERITESIDAFQGDEMLQVWVAHHLQVIGEAARSVSQSLKDLHPEVPWPEIVALRNILVHEYFGLNMHQVWTMTQKDLPELKVQVQCIRSQIAPDGATGKGMA
jgi:uncharacterized protein with HEPN domain